jgi:hypothetical protein
MRTGRLAVVAAAEPLARRAGDRRGGVRVTTVTARYAAETVEALYRLFRGRDDAHGCQNVGTGEVWTAHRGEARPEAAGQ